ncbi:MAG: protein-(glutamine-N5) methyltransferase, release factor-specific [Bacteroidetes bacterium 4572_77]|nr:MAG: protein-(glutamine-N5) methyltransferase, release factor-specific [Bacteroidetes bacterium 4572_77]
MIKTWKIIDIINWGQDYLKNKEIESPRLQIELLICNFLSLSRIELYMNHDKPLSKDELAKLKEAINRLVKHEPIQYILGETVFYDYTIKVNNAVLIPRPETEILVEESIKEIANVDKPIDILDIGTGSGCIAISISKAYPDMSIYGVDISNDAIAMAKENTKLNDTSVLYKRLDILTEIPNKRFSAIISNPPYINLTDYKELDENVKEYEPSFALTDRSDGLIFYKRFAEIFPQIIQEGGFFAIEIGFGQSEEICDLFSSNFSLRIIKDFAKIDRVIIGKLKN